jgi:hypothetical protein
MSGGSTDTIKNARRAPGRCQVMMRFEGIASWIASFCLSMISAQTHSAFVARENRFPLFRITLYSLIPLMPLSGSYPSPRQGLSSA